MMKWLAKLLVATARQLGWRDEERDTEWDSLDNLCQLVQKENDELKNKLDCKFVYDYPKANNTVDIVLICTAVSLETPEVLLVKRGGEPFKGQWCIPGGFVEIDELLYDAALRELKEETGISEIGLDFAFNADKISRDPRGRSISAVYFKFISYKPQVVAADDAVDHCWMPVNQIKNLAFDHEEIIKRIYYEC